MLIWSREAFVSALGMSLLHSVWQGTAVGLLAKALHSRLKRVTADLRYGAYCLLLGALFLAWAGSFSGLYLTELKDAALRSGEAGTLPLRTVVAAAPALAHRASPLQPLRSLAPALVLFWTLGVALLSLRHLVGLLTLQRMRRHELTPCPAEWQERLTALTARFGICRKICLRLSPSIDVPLTFGVFKPYLLLPPSALLGIAPAQLEALIAHELAHIRRKDALINYVQICVETVLFYHPVVWWLSAQIRTVREQCCDDLAVQVIDDRALYARALFSMEELRASTLHLALGAKGEESHMTNSNLVYRIRRVLGGNRTEQRAPWLVGALALGAFSIGLATLWPVQAHSTPTPAAKHRAQEGERKVVKKINVMLNFNGKKLELNTLDLTPDTQILVDGKSTRFGDLSQDEQEEIYHAVAMAQENLPNLIPGQTGMVEHTSILVNLNGKKIELHTLVITPDTEVTVDGKPAHFSDLSEEEQDRIRQAADTARSARPEASTSAENKQTSTRTSTHSTDTHGVITSVRTSQHRIDYGNNHLTVYGDTLKPDTLVTLNGVKSKFKNLSAADQKRLQAIWAHSAH